MGGVFTVSTRLNFFYQNSLCSARPPLLIQKLKSQRINFRIRFLVNNKISSKQYLQKSTMRKIFKHVMIIAVLFCLWTSPSFSKSEYVDSWIGIWTVKLEDDSIVTWKITHTWVSETRKSHLAYGIKNPGFALFYCGVFRFGIHQDLRPKKQPSLPIMQYAL